jgi:hypothetical protein
MAPLRPGLADNGKVSRKDGGDYWFGELLAPACVIEFALGLMLLSKPHTS